MQRSVSELYIYPVKSLGGISLRTGKVLKKGFQNDRRWMLVDENDRFITQRVHPVLSRFKLQKEGNGFLIRYLDRTLFLNNHVDGPAFNAVIWDDVVEVVEVSKAHSEWFSNCLGWNCKLVSFPEMNTRRIDPRYSSGNENVSLADAYPLLIIGQSSLDDLNSRMEETLPMDRFRPNIVFKGGSPYEEDEWKQFSIGGNNFRGVKLCSRCILTTIDQATGVKGREPLVTLSTYRKKENKVLFGQNVIPDDEGVISVGDKISIIPD